MAPLNLLGPTCTKKQTDSTQEALKQKGRFHSHFYHQLIKIFKCILVVRGRPYRNVPEAFKNYKLLKIYGN